MKIELSPTGKIETVNGTPARVWAGTTDNGVRVQCWIALVQADMEHASHAQREELDKTLRELKVDREIVSFDMRAAV